MAVDPVALLRSHGPLPAGKLAELMGASRPTLSRAVRGAADTLVVRGQARRTTYAARRALRGSLDPLPLFRIDRVGIPRHIADLDLLHPDDVAPIYDMLPMAYAPVRGVELPPRAYVSRLPLPSENAAWQDAASAALAFWSMAASDLRISVAFRRTCADNEMLLGRTVRR